MADVTLDKLRGDRFKFLHAGTNVTLTDDGKTITITATGGGGATPSGTDWRHVTAGVEDVAASTPTAANVGAVAVNGAITPATKTKITFDAKGLVTSGADATAADVGAEASGSVATHAALTTGVHGLGAMSQIGDAPSDGSSYVRKNAAWSVSTAGGIAKESHIPLMSLAAEVAF